MTGSTARTLPLGLLPAPSLNPASTAAPGRPVRMSADDRGCAATRALQDDARANDAGKLQAGGRTLELSTAAGGFAGQRISKALHRHSLLILSSNCLKVLLK